MTRIVLRPNASISQRRAWWIVASLVLLNVLIASVLALLGYWLVIPFAGLEIVALVLVFRWCLRQAEAQEVVTVDGDRVRVEVGFAQPERCCEFQRNWTQVLLEPSSLNGHPSRLLLRAAGRQVEVGAFLTEEERSELWQQLKRIIG